jgi:hypothetical protein
VVPLSGGTFGVQITIPDSYPTTVSSFATEAVAEDWITCNRQRVACEGLSGRWFKKPAYIQPVEDRPFRPPHREKDRRFESPLYSPVRAAAVGIRTAGPNEHYL